MTIGGFYSSPAAFRQALTDKLRALAKESKWSLEQLQRQIAYDRLLERLYLASDDWIVKGATALLARDLSVRGSLDVDLYRNLSRTATEADLRGAARDDIGDWFRFELAGTRPWSEGLTGVRIPVTAYIGATPWASFHVDLSGDGTEDDRPPRGCASTCARDAARVLTARIPRVSTCRPPGRQDHCNHSETWANANAVELDTRISSTWSLS